MHTLPVYQALVQDRSAYWHYCSTGPICCTACCTTNRTSGVWSGIGSHEMDKQQSDEWTPTLRNSKQPTLMMNSSQAAEN